MDKITYWVDGDPRPTCVLDLAGPGGSIYHKNGALQAQGHLVHDLHDSLEPAGFQAWALDVEHSGIITTAGRGAVYAYTIDRRWRIVQWLPSDTQPQNAQNGHCSRQSSNSELSPVPQKTDLNGKLQDALADRDNVTGRLSNLLQMMEMVDVGMFEYDREGVLVYGNDAFHRLSGVPKNETEKMAWSKWVFEEDREWLTAKWTQLTEGSSCTFDMRWIGPNAAENPEGQWVSAACVPTTDDAGNVLTVSGCITDIQAVKKRAEALERAQASEMRFSNFIKHSNVAFYNFGMDRKMKYCNREWFEMSGHPVVPFEDIDWSAFMNAENLAIVTYNWEQMIRTKQPTKFQFELNRPWSDGQELGEDGNIISVTGTLTDITHLKWAERLQKQRTDEAVEAKRQHESFIDMTCHEIRNPLGAVVHCADLVRSNLTDIRAIVTTATITSPEQLAFEEQCEAALESVGIIISCCAHQRRIVDDILTLSKLDSKLLTIAPSLTELDSMLFELEKMFEADARKADVSLRLTKDLCSVRWAMLDTGRLNQVLINLITNAVKFTAQQEAERTVTISCGVSQKRPSEKDLDVEFVPAGIARDRSHTMVSGEEIFLIFTVSDTGCGFGEEQKGRIFERFSQASPRTHSKYGGSGLGLFISREMIELQGGEIGVKSSPGHGATFAFYIAARTANAPLPKPRSASTLLSKTRSIDNAGAKFSILVVEDNLVNQKVLRMQLQRLGHEVYVVSHGLEALDFLRTTSCWRGNSESQIDLSIVLMDIEMPVMNGLECTQKIRELESEGHLQRHLPIIAVSANAREAQVRQAMEAGVEDAISKPFRVADLMPMVERLVDRAILS